MGTTCLLAAIPGGTGASEVEQALRDAEAELRAVEARMSVWLQESEISRLNRAAAGTEISLARETMDVLRAARDAHGQTEGAFDVTCGPLIELWKQAGGRGRLPSQAQVDGARAASSWDWIELHDGLAIKRRGEFRVDLGGIAKGYAIDRAVGVLRRSGAGAGLADVGGDLRCFGHPADRDGWPVDIKDPFGSGTFGTLLASDVAVCTSGNYARFTVIEGERYSHIIDPRTGWPADATPSVTVIAADAMTADIWATALSVLGEDGLRLLPPDVEALLILGDAADPLAVATPGALGMLEGPLRLPARVVDQPQINADERTGVNVERGRAAALSPATRYRPRWS
jgi:thiamine biosynthesis lipoprotein